MATIKDIAKALGLSHSVVSRALNPNPDKNARVSQETKDLVEQTARNMGYRPNRIAEFMKRGRSAGIGVFLPEYSNRLIADLVIGISTSANEHGFPVNFFFGQTYESYAAFINANIKNPSSGIISYPFNIDSNKSIDNLFNAYLAAGGKAILLNTTPSQTVPVLYMDEVHGAECAAQCLLKRKCDYFFSLTGFPLRTKTFHDFIRGHRRQCEILAPNQLSTALSHLNDKKNSSVGIFAPTDEIALFVLKQIKSTRFQIGNDIFLIGYDDLQLTALIDPPLTTIHQPFKEQGKRAIEKLVNLLYGKIENDEAITPRLVERGTA